MILINLVTFPSSSLNENPRGSGYSIVCLFPIDQKNLPNKTKLNFEWKQETLLAGTWPWQKFRWKTGETADTFLMPTFTDCKTCLLFYGDNWL